MIPPTARDRASSATECPGTWTIPDFVSIDLDFGALGEAKKLLATMEEVWAGPGKAFMVDPKARIVEIVESKELSP